MRAYASRESPAILWRVRLYEVRRQQHCHDMGCIASNVLEHFTKAHLISASTSNSHLSTAPEVAGLTLSMKGIFSPSTETIPVISPVLSNVSSFTASKHFLTKGWTLRGS